MDGFLGTRGSLMLDIVFSAMLATVPLLIFSRRLVRVSQRYAVHRRIQIVLSVILLLAIVGFEIEMRISGWTHRAVDSPFWVDGRANDLIDYSLLIHLCFAIPTPFLWGFVLVEALRKFPKPPAPSDHSSRHRMWGRLAMLSLTLTAITGVVFYWLAFAATA